MSCFYSDHGQEQRDCQGGGFPRRPSSGNSVSEKTSSRQLVNNGGVLPLLPGILRVRGVLLSSSKLPNPLVEILCLLWVAVRYLRLQPSQGLCPAIGRVHESVR